MDQVPAEPDQALAHVLVLVTLRTDQVDVVLHDRVGPGGLDACLELSGISTTNPMTALMIASWFNLKVVRALCAQPLWGSGTVISPKLARCPRTYTGTSVVGHEFGITTTRPPLERLAAGDEAHPAGALYHAAASGGRIVNRPTSSRSSAARRPARATWARRSGPR